MYEIKYFNIYFLYFKEYIQTSYLKYIMFNFFIYFLKLVSNNNLCIILEKTIEMGAHTQKKSENVVYICPLRIKDTLHI